MNTPKFLTRPIDFYRAAWRWHFYAGLMVLPFMIVLAVTGAIYLFHNEIDNILYHDLKTVPAASAATLLPADAIVASALAAHPGIAFNYAPPPCALCSAQVSIKPASGDKLIVFIDPARGAVLGDLPYHGGFSWTVRELHSLKYFGAIASGMIEIAAGWSILLFFSGIYLWWPRQARAQDSVCAAVHRRAAVPAGRRIDAGDAAARLSVRSAAPGRRLKRPACFHAWPAPRRDAAADTDLHPRRASAKLHALCIIKIIDETWNSLCRHGWRGLGPGISGAETAARI